MRPACPEVKRGIKRTKRSIYAAKVDRRAEMQGALFFGKNNRGGKPAFLPDTVMNMVATI